MKANLSYSANRKRKNGRWPVVAIGITPDNEAEVAILRMAYSGKRTVEIYENGNAQIIIVMPRGSNE